MVIYLKLFSLKQIYFMSLHIKLKCCYYIEFFLKVESEIDFLKILKMELKKLNIYFKIHKIMVFQRYINVKHLTKNSDYTFNLGGSLCKR